jgi:ribosomal protein L17
MASSFGEAIMDNMRANLDPMNGNIKAMAGAMVEQQDVEVTLTKASAVGEIESLLTQAKDRGAHASVITAYEKLLTRLSR